MGKATIEEYANVVEGNLGVVDRGGLSITNVTTDVTKVDTTLDNGTRAIRVLAEDTNLRVAVGVGAEATATSLLLASGKSQSWAVDHDGSESWVVSIINA